MRRLERKVWSTYYSFPYFSEDSSMSKNQQSILSRLMKKRKHKSIFHNCIAVVTYHFYILLYYSLFFKVIHIHIIKFLKLYMYVYTCMHVDAFFFYQLFNHIHWMPTISLLRGTGDAPVNTANKTSCLLDGKLKKKKESKFYLLSYLRCFEQKSVRKNRVVLLHKWSSKIALIRWHLSQTLGQFAMP